MFEFLLRLLYGKLMSGGVRRGLRRFDVKEARKTAFIPNTRTENDMLSGSLKLSCLVLDWIGLGWVG